MDNTLYIIGNAEMFAAEFTTLLSDPNVTMTNKQIFFMDNHEHIKETMASLNKVVSYITTRLGNGDVKPDDMSDEELNDMADRLQRAKTVLAEIKKAISDFQNTLTINKDVKAEDLPTVALTAEALSDVMQPKEKPKEIEAPKDTTPQISQPCNVFYTNALVINDEIYYIAAKTKEEINKAMNDIVENITDDGKEIKIMLLYALTPVDLPLKKKVVFTM